MLKRLLAMLLVLMMVISMVACDSGRSRDNDEDEDEEVESRADRKNRDRDKDVDVEDEEDEEASTEDEEADVDDNEANTEGNGFNTDDKESNTDNGDANVEGQDWIEYTTKDGSMSFTYPSYWQTMESQGADNVWLIGDTGLNLVLVIEEIPATYTGDLQNYFDLNMSNLSGSITTSDMQYTSLKVGKDGYDAKVATFKNETNNVNQRIIIMLEKKGYCFVITTPGEDIDTEYYNYVAELFPTIEIN